MRTEEERKRSRPYPGEEVFDAEHPIRHVFFEVPGATRLAVVYSGFERAYKPKYNYIERFEPLACHRLHVLDDMEARGCYYLGRDRDFFVARAIAALVDQRLDRVGLARGDVVTVGSSKGATAALHHALSFGFGEAIAAAPQVLLGRYLTQTVQARGVSRLIAGGDTPDDRAFLDTFLLDTVQASPYRPRLEFFISRDDGHYETHLLPLLAALDAKGHPYTVEFAHYEPHSAVGVPFSRHVLERLGTRRRGEARRARAAGVSGADVLHVDPAVPEPAGELEELLYRGGYLVHETRRALEPRAEDLARRLATWPEIRVGRYTLRFDRMWSCSKATAGDVEVVLLGTATHIERPELREEAIAVDLATALRRSQEAFYELLDHLSGAHVVLFRVGDRHVLLQDATGMESVHYDITGGARLAASHPGLIAELEGYEVSDFARRWLASPDRLAGGEYFPGLVTPYAQLRLLTPNTQLDLDAAHVERFYPRVPIGEIPIDEIVATTVPWLRNQWKWLRANHDVSASLTAGIDSRLTLAAAREVAPDLDFFTYAVWDNQSHEQDCQVATRLAERLGLRHEIYRVKYKAPVPDDLTEMWDRMYGGMRGGLVLAHAYLSRFPPGNLHVRSNVLETVRGFYLKNPANRPDRFDAAKLSRLFRGVTAKEFVPHFEEFARVTSFTKESKLDLHFSDLYYWEHRMGAWHTGVVSRSKLSHDTFIIFNCRKILQTMLALPLAERIAALNVWELMAALWPETLEEPIIYRKEPLARPERDAIEPIGRLQQELEAGQRAARRRWTTTVSRSSSSGTAS